MRSLSAVVFLFQSVCAICQLPERFTLETDSSRTLFVNEPLRSGGLEDVTSYLTMNCPNLSEPRTAATLIHEAWSPAGRHLTFEQTFDGVTVFGSEIKVTLNDRSHLRTLFDRSVDTRDWSTEWLEDAMSGFDSSAVLATVADPVLKCRVVIWPDPLQPALEITTFDASIPQSELLVIGSNGDVLLAANLIRTLRAPDSLVTAFVFLPDPLTTANQVYGFPYSDQNDAEVLVLNAERVSVQMRVAFNSPDFSLENQWVQLTDISLPSVDPPKTTTPDFNFTRSQNAFEDVNAYFHITNLREHMEQIGYGLLGNEQIVVDAHALNGDDQSILITSATPRQLLLGEGGVDDGEDADVIIHEYAHHLSYSASPNTNLGFERQAFEEGHADYFAASYSRALDPYNWGHVFSWDGHNEFWSGRVVNSNKVYPNDLGTNIHLAGEIWSAAMMEIWEALGRDYTDQLAMQAMYAWIADMTMPEAAITILQADDLLSGGANYATLYNIFVARGLLGELVDDVVNSQALLTRTGDLIVTLSAATAEADLAIFDVSGRVIFKLDNFKDKLLTLPNSLFGSSAVYFVRLSTPELQLVRKVVLIER